MFETAVVRAQTQTPERRVGLLTASVAVHTLAVAAIVIASIQSLSFPTHAPNQMSVFEPVPLIDIPIARGDHGPSPVARPQAPQTPRTVTAPPAETAPQVIPDATVAATPTTGTGEANNSNLPGSGDQAGDPNGVLGGLPLSQPAAAVAPPATDTVYPMSAVNPPVVITRVSPEFPRLAQTMHKSGWAIVECVIDHSGHIRDAHVTGSSWEVFEKPALDAVQQWVFKPGTLNGQAVNTLFELRVTFTLH